MSLALWPHYKKKELEKELRTELKSDKHDHFLVQNEKGDYLGFINLSLRKDYVEGATSKPVGYVEGIYVKPAHRKQGIAKELIKQAKEWAKKHGCKELGSDTELKNTDSQKVHKNLGFKKTNTIVHFIMKL